MTVLPVILVIVILLVIVVILKAIEIGRGPILEYIMILSLPDIDAELYAFAVESAFGL